MPERRERPISAGAWLRCVARLDQGRGSDMTPRDRRRRAEWSARLVARHHETAHVCADWVRAGRCTLCDRAVLPSRIGGGVKILVIDSSVVVHELAHVFGYVRKIS
jgi:hypothetical protein